MTNIYIRHLLGAATIEILLELQRINKSYFDDLCCFLIFKLDCSDGVLIYRSLLKQLVTSDLKKLLGVEGQPTFVK